MTVEHPRDVPSDYVPEHRVHADRLLLEAASGGWFQSDGTAFLKALHKTCFLPVVFLEDRYADCDLRRGCLLYTSDAADDC